MSSSLLLAVSSWEYLDVEAPPATAVAEPTIATVAEPPPMPIGVPEEEVNKRVQEAVREARTSWDAHTLEQQSQRENRLLKELGRFGQQRAGYFKQLEHQVVQLAMAIARKVLQREAELDPTLLLGLVRIALDRMSAEAPLRLHVAQAAVPAWRRACEATTSLPPFEVVGEPDFDAADCLVETSLGTADFSVEAQLRELEGALFDVLTRRPEPS